jgi:hypothetical protein
MNAPMGTPLHRVKPERLLHQHGEALLRRDFADQSDQDDQLRWWHTRALHVAYGVSEGLFVTSLNPGGQARVGPGVAFDAFGRELILADHRIIDVPETGVEYLLVISYDRQGEPCEERPTGLCQDLFAGKSGVRLQWVRRAAFTLADGVPLAILNERVECADRWSLPLARSHARPRIGHGLVVVDDEFDFDPWTVEIFERPFSLGVQLDIDTSAAGFTGTPCYFVDLTIHPPDPPPISFLEIMARAHIHAPTPDRFTLRFLSPSQFSPGVITRAGGTNDIAETGSGTGSGFVRRSAAQRGRETEPFEMRISWIGIQQMDRLTYTTSKSGVLQRFKSDGGGDELHP